MTNDEFIRLVENRIFKIRRVLNTKADEYATDYDRLHNFKRAGEIIGTDPADALRGMMVKHEVSVHDLIDVIYSDIEETITQELVNEKIGDLINYLILLEAIFYEHFEWTID